MSFLDNVGDFFQDNIVDPIQDNVVDPIQDFIEDTVDDAKDTVLGPVSDLIGFNALISQYAPPKLVNAQGLSVNADTTALDGDVVVVIHGWRSSYQAFKGLYETIESKYPDKQVVGLDWSELADLPGDFGDFNLPFNSPLQLKPENTARAIAYVAETIAEQLQTVFDVTGSELTIIGHSLGSLVASEMGRLYQAISDPIEQLVALDPAAFAKSYDIDGRDEAMLGSSFIPLPGLGQLIPGLKQTVEDFNKVAQNSLSLVVKDENLIAGLAGDNDFAATANDSFLVDFPFTLNPAKPHNAVIPVFNSALKEKYFTLEQADFGLPQHVDNLYNNAGKENDPTALIGHEGIITANLDGIITQYLPELSETSQFLSDGDLALEFEVGGDGGEIESETPTDSAPPTDDLAPTPEGDPSSLPSSPDELLDLTGFDGELTINVMLEREAGFDNLLQFYETDALGAVAGILPGEAGYEDAVRQNLLQAPVLSVENGAVSQQAIALTGGTYYAPALLVQGNLADLVTLDDAVLGSDRIQRDDNVWKFEDATDFDFDDLVLTVMEVAVPA